MHRQGIAKSMFNLAVDKCMKNKSDYIDLIINEMMPKIAEENLAEFVDVFCETNYFTVAQTDTILKAAKNKVVIGLIQLKIANIKYSSTLTPNTED